MMKKTYRVALIGCGWIGMDKHIPSLMATEDTELAALCDINPEQLATAVDKFGLNGIATYTDYNEMLKDESIDIVHIAVPNKLHCQITCACLRAGKHVLTHGDNQSRVRGNDRGCKRDGPQTDRWLPVAL